MNISNHYLAKICIAVFALIISSVSFAFDSTRFIEAIDANTINNATHQLNKGHKVLFFFSSKCSYCHKFVPILKKYQNENNLEIIAVSQDGQPLPGYDSPIYDPALNKTFNIQAYPTVVVVDINSGDYYPLTVGYSNYQEFSTSVNRFVASVERNLL